MTSTQLLLSIPIILAAFVIGFAIRRASICAVLAAEQWVTQRRTSRLRAFLTAACWAGVVMLLLAWLFPGWAAVSPGYPISIGVLIGGVAFGLGALINGACAFGTLAHLAGGELDFAGTILGVMVGALVVSLLDLHVGEATRSVLATPTLPGVAALAVFLAIAVRFTWAHFRTRIRKPGHSLLFHAWRPATAMVIIGVAGGFLHAMASEWTYMSVLSNRASSLVDPTFPSPTICALTGFTALLSGGVVAALLSGKFRITRADPRSFCRKMTGGMLMSGAAAVIPGGNDIMLIYGLPSLAPHAVAAYAVMMATLVLFFWLKQRQGLPFLR